MVGKEVEPLPRTEAEIETAPPGLYVLCDEVDGKLEARIERKERVYDVRSDIFASGPAKLIVRVRDLGEPFVTGLDSRIRSDGRQVLMEWVVIGG